MDAREAQKGCILAIEGKFFASPWLVIPDGSVYEPGVKLPSDLAGFGRVEIDSAGRWKHEVAKEINAAGIPVDFSKL